MHTPNPSKKLDMGKLNHFLILPSFFTLHPFLGPISERRGALVARQTPNYFASKEGSRAGQQRREGARKSAAKKAKSKK
jgi:hypothetical protein